MQKKTQYNRSLAVLRGHNGLMWLAAKATLACLLLEHVVASSFAIQRVRMISLSTYYYYHGQWLPSNGFSPHDQNLGNP